jgi:hypothetical protein
MKRHFFPQIAQIFAELTRVMARIFLSKNLREPTFAKA